MKTIKETLQNLSDSELIQLANEIDGNVISETALIRKICKEVYIDNGHTMQHIIGLAPSLAIELATRLSGR